MDNNTKIEKAIKDPEGIWYGPHECNGCGKLVIKKSLDQGGLTLDAPHNHHYPNHQWEIHICEKEIVI